MKISEYVRTLTAIQNAFGDIDIRQFDGRRLFAASMDQPTMPVVITETDMSAGENGIVASTETHWVVVGKPSIPPLESIVGPCEGSGESPWVDANGRPLLPGDQISIPARVDSIRMEEGYVNVGVTLKYCMPTGYGFRTIHALNARQVEKL